MLDEIREGWDQAAREDAMWNILTIEGKQGQWTPEEFFQHGRDEINGVLDRLDRLALRGEGRSTALDFGCGVGRLTQALADHYRIAVGVDVSREMIRLAQKMTVPTAKSYRCWFWHNERDDLKLCTTGAFDMVYSVITLQHMPPTLQQGYVTEFFRVLKPDGVAVFQLPEGPVYEHPQPWLSMYGTDPKAVTGWIEDAGGEVADVELTNHSGGGWQGWRYTARRRQP